MNDFLLLNIITKRFSKVVSIVKLSYDMFYLVAGPFLLKKHILLNWSKTPDKIRFWNCAERIHHRKDPFSGIANGSIANIAFWWENELSKSFGSRDRILPKYRHGRGHFRIFRQYLKFIMSLKYLPYDVI